MTNGNEETYCLLTQVVSQWFPVPLEHCQTTEWSVGYVESKLISLSNCYRQNNGTLKRENI